MATEKTKPLRTPEQARAWFDAHGINVSEWCRQRGFNRYVVVDLLRGKRKGRRGEAHLAAIALGLKAAPQDDLADQVNHNPARAQRRTRRAEKLAA